MKLRFGVPRGRGALVITALLCLVAMIPGTARADNPIVQTIYTADPAPLVHNGRVYLYTGHDEDGSTYFTMKEWRVWSSADMVNWTDHGSPMSVATFSWASADAWAGQAVYRNGKFYWYVPVKDRASGQMAIGVGVSTSPTGPFTDAIGRPLVRNGEIDPTVFIDDDGQAYLYWGNPNLWYVRLNADMISYSGSPTQIPLTTAGFGTRTGNASRPTLYEEGPWVYKRNGLYYNVFAAKCCSEFIGYSTAPGPTGPWTYRGTVMPTQGSSFTNHPGIIDFNGGSYFFYHNGALPGGGGFTRSVAVEKFAYNADGTIPTITMTTAGAPQVGTLNPYVRQEAETIAWESGVETEPASEGGMNVGWIENGDYVKVKGVAFGSGATSFSARVASATSGGRIELRLDGVNGTLAGTCTVPGTGGWQTWTTVTCPVSGATGTHDLYFRYTGGGGNLFNVNWWQFTGGATTGGNLLTNGDMESGTTAWGASGGTLSSVTDQVHAGARALSVAGRTASWNGITQDVTARLTNGRSHTTSVWVRSHSGTPGAKATLALTAGGTTNYLQLTPVTAVNSGGWTRLTGTATVSWSGTLTGATFYVETAEGTDGFSIDDASFQQTS
ncbi:Arabinoxylan arabinofuranohydrolase precursor [Nonomuraea coxensis DSM 45129]|uniref:Arabinoxylan arabinofuranohydrolase n=1 Tax=Nonomuraea coxensis DSM 45129 TaxID=1122611 RepID=A0ABX8U8V7_9ACTN|nr:family 43 glycosylhydrolase [Nonomuraea coxensis]QYC44226.1 Arabinoxylan arabinofuranohydrolase precursor [Nonomuraea coxensis DSM 45129]